MSTMKISGVLVILILACSVPGNIAIIKYLKEKPLGRQTILDVVYQVQELSRYINFFAN